jgi:hypothetical protein
MEVIAAREIQRNSSSPLTVRLRGPKTDGVGTVCTVWYTALIHAKLVIEQVARNVVVENQRIDELRAELGELLRKQAEVLELRSVGAATDTQLLEYEVRQEIIHEMCNQIANSTVV